MKRYALICLLPFISLANAATLTGHVVGVTDGDTITVLDATNQTHEIRLANIDAPETSCHQHSRTITDTCTEASQPFGKAAKQSLSSLVFDRDVQVVLEHGQSYGREIGTVYFGSYDVNLEQVQRGYAWHYIQFAKRQQNAIVFDQYQIAEKNARTNRKGLWQDTNTTPPWEYRHATH